MVGEAIQALGGLDVLVNNAGIAGPTAPVEHMDPDEWEKVIQVDLNGTFNVTRLAIPHLKNPRRASSLTCRRSRAGLDMLTAARTAPRNGAL
jgi:NAD(P)-dependent dehydrogenase (short-subunit alcohol dehydrogenase family)